MYFLFLYFSISALPPPLDESVFSRTQAIPQPVSDLKFCIPNWISIPVPLVVSSDKIGQTDYYAKHFLTLSPTGDQI